MDDSSKFVAYKVDFPIQDEENKSTVRKCTIKTCVEMGINAFRYNDTFYHGSYYLDIPECNKVQ